MVGCSARYSTNTPGYLPTESAIAAQSRIRTLLALMCSVAGVWFGSLPARAASFSIANVQVSHDSFAAHSEPAIAENPRNSNNLIAGSKFFTDPAHYQFKIGTFYTLDGGRSWHDAGLLPGFQAYVLTSDISIAFSATGVAYACVLAYDGAARSGIFVSRSTDGGKTWSAPTTVFLDTSGATFSDKPWIGVDRTRGPSRGTVYVAWNLDSNSTAKRHDPDAGDGAPALLHDQQVAERQPVGLDVARSTDGGQMFGPPVVVSVFDNTHFALGAIPQVAPNGVVSVAFLSFVDTSSGTTANSIDLVSSQDGGVTFAPQRTIVSSVNGLPNHLREGTFRNLSLPTFVVSPRDGSMVVAWADIRNGDADILTSRSQSGGQTWTAPYRVNHDHFQNGKDQFQPALAVAPNGTYTCSWFDRRRDPADRLIDVDIAQSVDGGLTFGHNVRITQKSWDPAIDSPLPEGKSDNTFIGDYQALAVDNQTVHPLWNDTQNGRSQEIRSAVVSVRIFARR